MYVCLSPEQVCLILRFSALKLKRTGLFSSAQLTIMTMASQASQSCLEQRVQKPMTLSMETNAHATVAASDVGTLSSNIPHEDLTDARYSGILKDLSSHLMERHQTDRTSGYCAWNYIIILLALIILLILVGLLYLAYKYRDHEDSTLCKTTACYMYRDMLKDSMDFEMNPCNNFYQYVCSRWDKNHNVPTYRQHLDEFFRILFKTLEVKVAFQHQSAVEKAISFFQSCRKAIFARGRESGEYKTLKSIWVKCGILWPIANQYSNILRTLICIYDSFYVSNVLGIEKRQDTSLPFVFPGSEIAAFERYGQTIKKVKRYQEYYERLRDLMKTPGTKKEAIQTYEDFLHVEDVVHRHLLKEEFSTVKYARINSSELAELTPNIPAAEWEQVFKSEYQLESPMVDVLNTDYMIAFNEVLSEVGAVELHRYVGWINVQQMASYINWEFFSTFLGKRDLTVTDLQPCLSRTEGFMGWATFARYATDYLDNSTREDMHHIIGAIGRTLSQKLSSSTWQVDQAPDAHQNVQRSLNGLLLYADRFARPEDMDVILSNISDMGGHVLLNWMNASKESTKIDPYLFSSIITFFQRQMEVAYYTFWNRDQEIFLMPPYVAMLPVYNRDINNAVKYGALGTLIADTATKLMYRNYPSIRLRNWPCLSDSLDGGVYDRDVVTSALSLHIAWEAFQAAPSPELRLLPVLHDTQLFFVAACFLMCGGSDAKRFVRKCNEPLRHSLAFSTAFLCPEDSPMNAKKKCAFF
ncbi:endothelin-converting enzyme 2-like [Ornithodoros turicata]|uniref:endothelin-converting enzyme 2-like n=1 Tax=Ornithodoros turicata TaxID=34597 RepID=UPI0031394CA4